MEQYKDSFIPLEDPRHKVVETVVKHLAQRNQDIEEVSRVEWSVHVVDLPAINTFVLPVSHPVPVFFLHHFYAPQAPVFHTILFPAGVPAYCRGCFSKAAHD